MKRTFPGMMAALVSFGAERAEVKNISVNGGIEEGKARLVIEAALQGLTSAEREKLLYSTTLNQAVRITREKQIHNVTATFDVLQGEPKELTLAISGDGEIKTVTGEMLQDWSVRQETNGMRVLVLRPKRVEKKDKNDLGWPTQLVVMITAERANQISANPQTLLSFAPPNPALFSGYLQLEVEQGLSVETTNIVGLTPLELKFVPATLRARVLKQGGEAEPLAFRFQGSAYSLSVIVSAGDPDARRVVLRDFQLAGRITNEVAEFTLTATAQVKNPKGGRISILSGKAALAQLEEDANWKVRFENGRYFLVFDKAGEFPVRLRFNAAVNQNGAWKSVDFAVAPGMIAPMTVSGLGPETQFEFTSGAKPERAGEEFRSFLPADGKVQLAWKEAAVEAEGKLFYSAEMLSQISISPGLMRQTAFVTGKVMQGELTRIVLDVRGDGSVTAVSGASVLAWNIEGTNPNERRIVVTVNQAQKDTFALQIQMQTELGAFPQSVEAMRISPQGATRFE